MESKEQTRKNANEKENKTNMSVFSRPVRYLNPFVYFFIGVYNAIKKAVLWVLDLLWSMVLSLWAFVVYIGKGILAATVGVYRFFKRKAHQFYFNDLPGRLSYIFFGASSFANKQIVNGILFLGFEIGYIIFFAVAGVPALAGLGTLGTTVSHEVCDEFGWCQLVTGDNSIMILIYGLLTALSILIFLYIWNRSINSGYFNYRIRRFDVYEEALRARIPFSHYLDEQVNLAMHGNLDGREGEKYNSFQFKTIFKDEIAAEIEKSSTSTEAAYSKFLISETIRHSYAYYRRLDKENLKHKRLERCLDKYKELRAERLTLLKEKNAYLLEYFTKEKVQSEIDKYHIKRDQLNAHLAELKEKKSTTIDEFNRKTDEKVEDNEYLLKVYQEKRKLELEKIIAKFDKSIASIESQIYTDEQCREKMIEKYQDDLMIKVEKHENATMHGVTKREQKISKHDYKVQELVKRYAPFVEIEHTRNNNRYGRFNRYFSDLAQINNEIRFYENYFELVDIYNNAYGKYEEKNEANRQELVNLLDQKNEKLAKTSAKFEEIRNKKAELNARLDKFNSDYEARVKELKTAYAENKKQCTDPRELAELKSNLMFDLESAKNDLVDKTTEIMRSLHDLPTNKMAKSLEKEETRESLYSYKRDRKYLKTNYTPSSYAKEEVINAMILEYKLEYNDARYYAEKMFVKCANSEVRSASSINLAKNVRFMNEEEINEKLSDLNTKKTEFVENNPTRYVGRPKTFVEQTKGLFNENFNITILFLPVLGILLFTIIPLVFSIFIAFTNYSYGHQPPTQLFTWIGWENFITIFNPDSNSVYSALPKAILNTVSWTLIWAVAATFTNYFLGIIVALMINKEGIRFKKFWRTIFILTIAIPQFISLLSIGTLLKDTGAIGTWYFQTFGSRMGFGSDADTVTLTKFIIIIVNIWVGIPYTILSTTGILMNIPKDLYESAKVDGAGTVTQFLKITLPYILFVTGPYLITNFVGNINNFNVIYFLTGGKPAIVGSQLLGLGQTDLLITFLFKIVTSVNNPQYGIASVIGIVVFIICSFFSIVMFNKSGAIQEEDQFQ